MNDRRASTETEMTSEVSRDDVRDYYSKAAVATQESLCCPVNYDPGDLSHIPSEVMDISYGCGSPVNRANIAPGESHGGPRFRRRHRLFHRRKNCWTQRARSPAWT